MDITVTPTPERPPWVQTAWALTDLLGRPLGSILEEPGSRFFIEPDERAPAIMDKVPLGPFASLDDALRAIEKHLHRACRRAPDQR